MPRKKYWFELTEEEIKRNPELIEITRQRMQRAVDAILSYAYPANSALTPPITGDDVIDAHALIQSLGADWIKHLPLITSNN